MDNEFAILDTLKICDTALFLISAAGGMDYGVDPIDEWGNKNIISALAQVSYFYFLFGHCLTFRYF